MPPPACPACRNVALAAHQDPATGLTIDSCPSCDGLWFDAHELSAFLQDEPLRKRFMWSEATEPLAAIGYTIDTQTRRCPRCRIAMGQRLFGGVTLDVCDQCHGIWFDHGEVRLVVERFQHGTSGDEEIRNELRAGLDEHKGRHRSILNTLMGFLHHHGHAPKT